MSTSGGGDGSNDPARRNDEHGVNRTDEYAAALTKLDELRAAGQVTQPEYDVKRARLLAEASHQPQTLAVRFLTLVAVIVAALILLRLIGSLT